MPSQDRTRAGQSLPLAAVLALFLAFAATAAAGAETSGTITVRASVDSVLSLTLCDTEASFGAGLNAFGDAPTNTSDVIGATAPSPNPGEGVFYHWTPSCQADGTGKLFEVVAASAWTLAFCATENVGEGASPTITIANRSLKWALKNFPLLTYQDVTGMAHGIGRCDEASPTTLPGSSRSEVFPGHLYLRIDGIDLPGTFYTTVTWGVTPD
jgi:hypothetical protein